MVYIDKKGFCSKFHEDNLNVEVLCYHANTAVSLDPRGFVKCSLLIQSLFDTLVLTWNK